MQWINQFSKCYSITIGTEETDDLYRNNMIANNFGMHSNMMNGHDMQMDGYQQSIAVNGYSMSLKQEPESGF